MFQKNKNNVLTREDIFQANDIVTERVAVPEWGGDVFVRGMAGEDRDNFEASMVREAGKSKKVNLSNVRAKLCAATVVDEEGKKLFTPSDIAELTKKSAAALQRVYEVASRLSGLGEDDIDELAEGLEDSPFDASLSD